METKTISKEDASHLGKQKLSANIEQGGEIEKLIIELGKKGITAEKIGLILRDEHGFQKNKTPIKISEILKKHNLYIQPDIQNLQKKIGIIKDHMKKNKGDVRGKRDLVRLESNLNRNKKYFS